MRRLLLEFEALYSESVNSLEAECHGGFGRKATSADLQQRLVRTKRVK